VDSWTRGFHVIIMSSEVFWFHVEEEALWIKEYGDSSSLLHSTTAHSFDVFGN